MTTDQHRIGQLAKAQLLIADALERHATDPRDPTTVAAWLVDELQGYGWRPPFDPTADVPPLRPDNATTDGPGYTAWLEARAALAARRTNAAGHADSL